MKHQVYLSLGSNTGNRAALMQQAIEKIGLAVGTVVRTSRFIETEPWGFVSEHQFLNACICVETLLSPRQVLEATQRIERQLGRKRKSENGVYHDRPIDIDILLFDDMHINEPDLIIPHPLMLERDFVMIPLRQILPTPPQENNAGAV